MFTFAVRTAVVVSMPCIVAACAGFERLSDRQQVHLSVASASAGVSWETPHAPSVLYAVELDGRGIAYSWGPGVLTDERAHSLKYCLDRGPTYRPLGRASPPGWQGNSLVSAEVSRCLIAAGLPDPTRRALRSPLRTFDVWMRVDNSRTSRGSGTPVWSQGGSTLGAMRTVRPDPARGLAALQTDMGACRDAASRRGVVETFESAPPGGFGQGMYLQSTSASIEAYVRRFDQCLLDRKHEVGLPASDEVRAPEFSQTQTGTELRR